METRGDLPASHADNAPLSAYSSPAQLLQAPGVEARPSSGSTGLQDVPGRRQEDVGQLHEAEDTVCGHRAHCRRSWTISVRTVACARGAPPVGLAECCVSARLALGLEPG
jgi:hypothetical protein